MVFRELLDSLHVTPKMCEEQSGEGLAEDMAEGNCPNTDLAFSRNDNDDCTTK